MEPKIDGDISEQLYDKGFIAIELLGEGAFGSVYLVNRKEDPHEKYAVKVIETNCSDLDVLGFPLVDISCSLGFKHPNIVSAIEYFRTNEYIYVVMECGKCDLHSLLQKRDLGYVEKLRFIHQLASAMDYILSLGFVHADLKLENILVGNNKVMLCDFGLVRVIENYEPDLFQTLHYRCPELLSLDEYWAKFDPKDKFSMMSDPLRSEMWSFGLICLCIIYNIPEITLLNSKTRVHGGVGQYIEFIFGMLENGGSYDYIVSYYGESTMPDLLEIINKMFLQVDPRKRVSSYKTFLNDPLFELIQVPEIAVYELPYDKSEFVEVPRVCDHVMLDVAVKWIAEVGIDEGYPVYVVYDTIELFLRRVGKYAKNFREIQLFVLACLWVMSNFHLYPITIGDLMLLCEGYKYAEINNKILELIDGESCKFLSDRLYRYMWDRYTLTLGLEIMKKTKSYMRYNLSDINSMLRKKYNETTGVKAGIVMKDLE